jgi:NADH:ubiquinone oxidoreductase subunit F (NADH-binding)
MRDEVAYCLEGNRQGTQRHEALTRVPPPLHRLLPPGKGTSRGEHLERYGPLPRLHGRAAAIRFAVEESGLTGRGGAGFPTAAKLEAVAAGDGTAVVVANGTEGEPASAKDKVLLQRNPHLVLDGVLVAMAAVEADEAFVAIAGDDERSRARLEAALREREREARRIYVARVPDRFVAGEESALVNWLSRGPATPTFKPPRPFERGVNGRPTLVQNVETLANLGLIARFGSGWFRELGTADEPGSVLVTVRGAVRQPGVVEVPLGTPIRRVLDVRGGLLEPAQALLVGGYFGTWIRADGNLDLPLSQGALRPLGASLGARTIALVPRGVCGLAETARIVRYLAGESAGQCGPCLFGLPAVADAFDVLARGGAHTHSAHARLARLEPQIVRRGACAHPDGTMRLVASALSVFSDELERHASGRCSATNDRPLLPTAWRGVSRP